MKIIGFVVALITIGCALYALYWAGKEEVVQAEEGVAGGEAAAECEEAEEAAEIGPAAGYKGAAIPLESETTPEEAS